jgi:hypothetical protein
MQKALTQMNLQIHHVISEITGVTGLGIVDAILAGERDPAILAKLRDHRIRASEEIVQKSLVGNWKQEHLFTLKQSRQIFRYYEESIAACRCVPRKGVPTGRRDREAGGRLRASRGSRRTTPAARPQSATEKTEEEGRQPGC